MTQRSKTRLCSSRYPGIYGGEAVARALFGDDNRFGKTPVTIYGEGFTDELDMLSFDMGAGVGRSYRYYEGKNLLYPMGESRSTLQWRVEL